MTYNPSFDRTDWRLANERRLIEAARESGHELCIALGERLEACDDFANIIADLIAERDELNQRCDALRRELNELHEALKSAGTEAL